MPGERLPTTYRQAKVSNLKGYGNATEQAIYMACLVRNEQQEIMACVGGPLGSLLRYLFFEKRGPGSRSRDITPDR